MGALNRVVLAAMLYALVAGPVVVAQESGETEESREDEEAAAAATTEKELSGEEMTVTARKREENLHEVPFSVVAPTEELLRRVDQERGTLARVGYLTNQPRQFGISARINF